MKRDPSNTISNKNENRFKNNHGKNIKLEQNHKIDFKKIPQEDSQIEIYQKTLEIIFRDLKKFEISKDLRIKSVNRTEIESNKDEYIIHTENDIDNLRNKRKSFEKVISLDSKYYNNFTIINTFQNYCKDDNDIPYNNFIRNKLKIKENINITIEKEKEFVSKKIKDFNTNLKMENSKIPKNMKFSKFKEDTLKNLDIFENLQNYIDYLINGSNSIADSPQFILLGQFTYISKGNSFFDLFCEKQKSKKVEEIEKSIINTSNNFVNNQNLEIIDYNNVVIQNNKEIYKNPVKRKFFHHSDKLIFNRKFQENLSFYIRNESHNSAISKKKFSNEIEKNKIKNYKNDTESYSVVERNRHDFFKASFCNFKKNSDNYTISNDKLNNENLNIKVINYKIF